jgi:hypothetical protein
VEQALLTDATAEQHPFVSPIMMRLDASWHYQGSH